MAPSPAVAPLPARGSGDAEAGPLSAKLTRSLTHSPTVTKRNHIAIHSLDVEEVGWPPPSPGSRCAERATSPGEDLETDPPGGGQAWELLAPFDKDGSGLVDPKELAEAAKLLHKHQKERRLLLGVIGVLAATVVGLLVQRLLTGS